MRWTKCDICERPLRLVGTDQEIKARLEAEANHDLGEADECDLDDLICTKCYNEILDEHKRLVASVMILDGGKKQP